MYFNSFNNFPGADWVDSRSTVEGQRIEQATDEILESKKRVDERMLKNSEERKRMIEEK